MRSPLIEDGLAALRAGDAAAARRSFERAVVDAESGAALEGLAESLYLEQEYATAGEWYERAYAAYRRERQYLAAGRAARTAAWIAGNVLGDWAVQSGWLGRARSILTDLGEDSAEHGWALIIEAFAEPDPAVREKLLHTAIGIGRRLGDPDVEFEAVVCLGGVFILTGRFADGLVLIDEALAATCAGELAEVATVDSVFCLFFWACELVNDVPRADQWMRRAAELMEHRNVAAAYCRAHYGGILTAAGRWAEAEAQLVESTRRFDHGMPRTAALTRLADLRLRQGRLEEADQLLVGLDTDPDAARTLAALHLIRGETALARDLLDRCIAGVDGDVPRVGAMTMIGPLLALLVDRRRGFGVMPTNDDLTLVIGGWPIAEFEANKTDVEGNYLKTLDLVPSFADRIRAARRETRFVGAAVPNYIRQPFGPGWALVGDAGYNKDFITAQGITDAFRDAELCAAAVHEALSGSRPFDAAMTRYQNIRDQHVLPMYAFTTQLATLEQPPPELARLLAAASGNRDASDAFARVNAGVMSPAEFLSDANAERILAAAHSVVPGGEP